MRDTLAAATAAAFCLVFSGAAHAQDLAPEPFNFSPSSQFFRTVGTSGSFLGVNLREIDSQRAKELKLPQEEGVEITRVEDNSPAAQAGLKAGDVVLSYNGEHVEGMEQFSRLVRETPPGREVKLQISRDGNTQTLTARIGARKSPYSVAVLPRAEFPPMPIMPDLPRTLMMWRSGSLGVEAEALRGQMADFFGTKEGVLVRSVLKDTPAARAGLKAGDVITKIGDSKVATPSDITTAIRAMGDKATFPITVIRDHKDLTLSVTVDDDRSDWPAAPPAPARITARPIKL